MIKKLLTVLFSLVILKSTAQSVTITPGTTQPSIEAKSTLNGVKIPSMSSYQRESIANPTAGLLVYDSDKTAIYMYNGNNWVRFAFAAEDSPTFLELTPNYTNSSGSSNTFGTSIAASQGYYVVGDPESDKVTIWKSNNGKYDIHSVLTPPASSIQPSDNDYGNSVAFGSESGEIYLAVGHPGKMYSTTLANHGAVHIYKLTSNVWVWQTTIFPSSTTTDDRFGHSISMKTGGDGKLTLFGGAIYDDLDVAPNTSNVGSLFIYTKAIGSGTWTQKHKFQDATANSGNNAGWSVDAINSNYVIFGAPGNNSGRGAVYSYKYNTGTTNYDFFAKVIPSDVASGDNFGFSVATFNDKIMVGSPYADVSGKTNQGKAYKYDFSYSAPYDEEILIDEAGLANDNFGYSVGLDYFSSIVSAPFKDANGITNSGAVIRFKFPTAKPTTYELITDPSPKVNGQFGIKLLMILNASRFVATRLISNYSGQIVIVDGD